MKRVLALVLAVSLLFVFTGCGAATVKTGIGVVTSIAKSADVTEEKAGLAQVDTIMAAVTIDADGKVLGCSIDSAQTKINFDNAGMLTVADKTAEVPTKKDLGSEYGMKKASGLGRDWHEEIADLEKWMVGKTADQISNMKVKEIEGKKGIPDEADLTSKVTISVSDYQKAVVEAIKNAQ